MAIGARLISIRRDQASSPLLACSREAQQIVRLDAATGVSDVRPFIANLPDFPAFLALVDPIQERER